MFCLKCGEAIPDNSVFCPKCGALINSEADNGQAVVYASQKEINNNSTLSVEENPKKNYYIWCAFAVLSFVFMALNYFKVSIDAYSRSSAASFTGYGLLKCLNGAAAAAAISGYMSILLIVNNIAVMITGFIGTKALKANVLRIIMLIESILYLIAVIVPYFNIKKVLDGFNSKFSTTSIGMGCYLNIILAVIVVIYYFVCINKQLKEG